MSGPGPSSGDITLKERTHRKAATASLERETATDHLFPDTQEGSWSHKRDLD